jgi:diguanylate cyclase (GGDEF)-like protein
MKNMRQKKILVRISIIFALSLFLMLILGSFVLNHVLMNSVKKLENMNVNDNLSNINKAIDNKLNYLKTLTKDWGAWNDTYMFVQDHNENYLQDNLADINYSTLNINFMAFLDNSGQMVYGRTMDYLNSNKSVPANNDIKAYLSQLDLHDRNDPDYCVQGIVSLPEGDMLIASHHIVKSDSNGPVRGNVIFGRYLNDSLVKELSDSLNLNINTITIQSNEYMQIKETNQNDDGLVLRISPINSDIIQGAVYIPDLLNKSASAVIVTMPRNIFKVGRSIVTFTILAFIAIFSVMILLLWALTNKYVISRISKLHNDVASITVNKNLSQRVEINGSKDELYDLADNINSMLGVTEALNSKIQKSNENLERRTEELMMANSALLAEKEKIKHMAYHDNLTGLPNGIYFHDFLNREINSSNRSGSPLAVLFIDLDGFKMINDTLGHAAGDVLLILVAKRLNAILRKSDFISRIGGDEFIILINNVKNVKGIETIASKILKVLSEPFNINNQECFITASIGISLSSIDGSTAEELTKNADLSMYRAKEKGKNQYCFCNQEMKEQIIENMVLSNQLWRALERDEFELYYQPQINCMTGQINGMEALIRWNHQEKGMIMPGKFISLAEQTGAIITIGNWVLNTACKQCKVWQEKYSKELRIAVNVSVKQLHNHAIVQSIEKAIKDTGFDPSKLELEVTESIFVKEVDSVIHILNQLKNLGVDIALDDFGTEYASMSYLKHMPIDKIKIAMPFIQGLDISEKDKAITKAIIILAKNMGMSVIAEGVETQTQHDFLMQKLCDEMQGFYFYRPMSVENMEDILYQNFIDKKCNLVFTSEA